MTVKELIEQLNKFENKDLEVLVYGCLEISDVVLGYHEVDRADGTIGWEENVDIDLDLGPRIDV